ncbi:MAG: hypothetical protein ACRCZI_02490 [Cetobacterium sp.]
MTTHVYYHAGCIDGFTAAWVVHNALSSAAVLVPWTHNTPVDPSRVEGVDLVFVDIAPARSDEEALCYARSVLVLDHHKTAIEAWPDAEERGWTLDANRSGAGIAWDRYHTRVARTLLEDMGLPLSSEHRLVSLVEARDLWQLDKYPDVVEVNAALMSLDQTIENWDSAATAVDRLVVEGAAIQRYRRQLIEATKAEARNVALPNGELVLAANAPWSIGSEVAGDLAGLAPISGIGGYWYETADGDRKWGLRSRDVDVAVIAEAYGGGGHAAAAGFVLPARP